jgi:spore germination protein GerM
MKRKQSSIGCLFWVALILLILVIFLFNRKTIEEVLETTGFSDLITKEERPEEEPEVHRVIPKGSEDSSPVTPAIEPTEEVSPEDEQDNQTEAPTVVLNLTEDESEEKPAPPPTQKKLRRSKLFFVEIDDEGLPHLKGVVRPVYYTDSPLTETLEVLLRGLSPSELNMGFLSLIPEGTELLSVAVSNRIAFINFNETIRFNTFGYEGYKAQLMQIIYTATEFSTVDSVQILIEGKREQYLGPEGFNIMDPLTRDSF